MKIIMFLIFNVGLPLFDMATDLQAFVFYLFYYDHPNWALLTLFWIFNPFLIHLCKFLFILANERKVEWWGLFVHFPFVLPLRNCYLAFELYKLRFGMSDFNSKDWERVESIQTEVARSSLTECYYEAGPQASQQIYIGLCTGHFRWNIIVSIVISLFSLSWGASRTFFIERDEDEADPDPDVLLVAFRVFPFMALMVTNSLFMWVLLAGLLGHWVFLELVVNFLVNYATVRCFYKNETETNQEEESDIEMKALSNTKQETPYKKSRKTDIRLPFFSNSMMTPWKTILVQN